MRGQEKAIWPLECVGLPGTIPARAVGVLLLSYSGMRDGALNYKKQNIPSTNPNYVGSQRVIKAFQEFQPLEDNQGKYLQIVPYVLTGSGEYFAGRKAIIKLGNLGEAVA